MPSAGEPDFAAIQGCFRRVQAWLREQGLDPLFGLTVGVAYAAGGQMARYDCCVQVPESVQVGTDEIAVQNLPGGRYAVLSMAKDPMVIGPSIGRFYGEYVPQHGLVLDPARPTYEVYWEKTMEYSSPLLAPNDPDPQARLRWVQHEARRALESLRQTPLCDYVDFSLAVPKPYCGAGDIRLIVLGQDPTVKEPAKRAEVHTVLNLDKRGGLLVYVARICAGLGLDLRQNVYATNLFKGFFVAPPTQIEGVDVLGQSLTHWLPLLEQELSAYPRVPVITLGEPLLEQIVLGDASAKVRDYWGYTDDWAQGETLPYRYLEASSNRLNRMVFPFPHQPSIRKAFYRERLDSYIASVRSIAF
jgi:DNA gyrase inhibitor GyrI